MPLIRYLTKHAVKTANNEKKGKFKYYHNKNRLHSRHSRHFLSGGVSGVAAVLQH